MRKLRFDTKSFLIFLLIFAIEIIIALFVDDAIIRPYGGDFLVVIMLYYLLKTFVRSRSLYLVIGVLMIAYIVEFAQYCGLLEALSLQNNALARVVIGSSFSWIDILAYTLGALVCLIVDRKNI